MDENKTLFFFSFGYDSGIIYQHSSYCFIFGFDFTYLLPHADKRAFLLSELGLFIFRWVNL